MLLYTGNLIFQVHFFTKLTLPIWVYPVIAVPVATNAAAPLNTASKLLHQQPAQNAVKPSLHTVLAHLAEHIVVVRF